jgi:hypothetical protein
MGRLLLVFTAVLLAAGPVRAGGVELHVNPHGNDEWSGRFSAPRVDGSDGPLATLGRSQTMIRELLADPDKRGPITVTIHGTHRLDQPLVFTPRDSGTAAAPVVWRSAPGETAVLSGARVITGWQRGGDGTWFSDLPDVKAGRWYFRQLFIDGRRAVRARTPNDGYLCVERLVDPEPNRTWNHGVDRFGFFGDDIKPWPHLDDVEVIVFHSWNTSRVRIASVDSERRIVTFAGPTVFRPLAWDPQQRYFIENTAEACDARGEWYLDRRAGRIHYRPLAGEDMTKVEAAAPALTELLRFEGDADAGQLVQHVRVEGLSFQHADWTLAPAGYGNDPQAAVTIGAAVTADAARDCALDRCEVAHVGGYGIWFRRGCKRCRISRNEVHDLGAGGVRLGEPQMAKTDEAMSGHNEIVNNYIHNGGRVYPEGVGFWMAHASHNRIAHNEIHSFDYSGMSIGWNWSDTQPTRTQHNTIEFNRVHHVVRGMLSDGGGIYTLGTQTGTLVRNNIFHDIWPYMGKPAMAWGIYFDQGSNGITVENNVVYHALTGGLMNTGQRNNTIRNNIFALSAWEACWRTSSAGANPDLSPSVVERNIFFLTQGELFRPHMGRTDDASQWDYNLFWRTDGEPLRFDEDELSGWRQAGRGEHSVVADPKFADPANADFTLASDSPALPLGFKPIDTSQVGLQGDRSWVDRPRQVQFEPTMLPPVPPPPPPLTLDEGFETTPGGAPPPHAVVSCGGATDRVAVTEEIAARGKRSLRITDSPDMTHFWDPHFFYQPHHRRGTVTASFDIHLGPGADAGHEWRDHRAPYRVGPSLRIGPDGRLTVGGKHLLNVPRETWITVAVTCGLGEAAAGTWDLDVTMPGQPPQRFERLPCGSPQFDQLEWLGTTSLAKESTIVHIDNIRLDAER